ncbi:MAG: ACT domain-containing protein [Pseudomonadota bacterium]
MQTGFVRDLQSMLLGMEPALDDAAYAFTQKRGEGETFALINEGEGAAYIIRATTEPQPHFARITLQVHSDLEGVGLTAAVATALAAEGIACNVIAAFHHDHLFVPWDRRDDAMVVLKRISDEARG